MSPRVRECSTHRSHRVRTTLFSALYCEGSLYQAASFCTESELFCNPNKYFVRSLENKGAKTNEQKKIIFYFQKPNFLYNRNIIRLSDLLRNRPIRYLRPDTILNRHRSRVFYRSMKLNKGLLQINKTIQGYFTDQ